jgi:signal transduction histidine kinase
MKLPNSGHILTNTPKSLRDANTRLNLALKASGIGIHEYNMTTGEVYIDVRAREILCLQPDEHFDIDQFWQLLHPEDVEMVRANIANLFEADSEKDYLAEYRICPRDGSPERHIYATGVVVYEQQDGKITPEKLVGTIQDVTSEHRKESELRKAKESAEVANRAKTAFLSEMSHEIRTPLTAINGYAELLSGMLNGEPLEIVKEMREAGDHLLRTLNSVIKFAKMEGAREEPEIVVLDLSKELGNVAGMFRHKASEKSINICVEASQSLYARADRSALDRILTNLLDNAIKFSPEQSTVTLRVCMQNEEFAKVCVEDQGRGISPEFKDQIFQPFTQEREKQDTALGGSGLGLVICRQLALAMRGDIQFESQVGRGSCFTLTLPIAAEADIQDLSAKANEHTETKAASGQTFNLPRILACDDYANTRRVLEISLRGYHLDLAANEKELFEKLDGQDIILLDINLNGKNVGKELLPKLRQTDTGLKAKIFAFTAHALPGQGDEFIQHGFDGYLEKPFTQKRLFEVLGLTTGSDADGSSGEALLTMN